MISFHFPPNIFHLPLMSVPEWLQLMRQDSNLLKMDAVCQAFLSCIP